MTARQQLAAEYTDRVEFQNVWGFVYCSLSDEESLRLSMRHNVNGHLSHKVTHRDYVS